MHDIVIVGSGPAGISAALYAVRGGLSVLLVGAGIGELGKAKKIDNYYGLPGIDGKTLHEIGIRQAKDLGVEMLEAEVTGIGGYRPFEVETTAGVFRAHAVVIATGRPRRKPQIPGLTDFEGRGVSYCAVCDGFFFRQKSVGILGAGAYAVSEARALKGLASEVVLFTDGAAAPADLPEGVRAETRRIRALKGNAILEGIELESGETVPVQGFFVALGTASGPDFAATVGLQTENGFIKIDRDGATNVPGIFAAGDVTGGFLQLTVAVGEGANAGQSAVKYVKNQNHNPPPPSGTEPHLSLNL